MSDQSDEALEGLDDYIDFEDLEWQGKTLGKGQFGEVMRASLYGTDVAVKRMFQNDDPEDQKYIARELKVLQHVHHPNVMQYMGVCQKDGNILLVTEFVEGGDLRELLKSDTPLSWPQRIRFALDTTRAIAYLHSRKIIHRDLKSKNLLVDSSMRVKVCDFGFARTHKDAGQGRQRTMTVCGTDEWMAPEVILGMDYDEKADVFSLGIVYFEVMTRKRPSDKVLARTPQRLFELDFEELKRHVPADSPAELTQIIIDCCQYEPHNRPHAKDLVPRLKSCLDDVLQRESVSSRPRGSSLGPTEAKNIQTIVRLKVMWEGNISSVALFAHSDQHIEEFLALAAESMNKRASESEKVVAADLALCYFVKGQEQVMMPADKPYEILTQYVGNKGFEFRLYKKAQLAARPRRLSDKGKGIFKRHE
eukprot:TRINITY_DN2912_c0_g1_i1.p1 TRINITY_DN2912_c0_g1~~TRINITY_DN2912_c0_g1_i1.p1  ORF type:complete len:429 (-),score=118.27 TRINITY_DN2912_c0_g1_i1:238-1497(-)